MDFRPRIPLRLLILILAMPAVSVASDTDRDRTTDTARTHYEAGDFAAAESIHRARLERAGSDDADAAFALGRALMAQGRWSDAVEVLEGALPDAESDARYHRLFGEALGRSARDASLLKQLGIAKRGLAHFERAVALDPRDLDARDSLMEYYLQAPRIAGGGEPKAIAQARAVETFDGAAGQRMLGRIHHYERRHDAARQAYEKALAIDSGHLDARIGQARLGFDLEDWTLAFDALDAVLARDAEHVDALYELGRAAAESGRRIDDGIATIERYLARPRPVDLAPVDAITPETPTIEALWLLGRLRAAKGDPDGARAAFDRLLTVDPRHRGARRARRALDR